MGFGGREDGPSVIPNRKAMKFGMKVYKQLFGAKNKNTIISPLALYYGLGVVYMGASGETKNLLKAVLDLPYQKQEAARVFWRMICKYIDMPELVTINRIYYKTGMTIKKDTKYLIKKFFRTDPRPINFSKPTIAAEKINKWFDSQTNGKITDVVLPNQIGTSTSMISVCACTLRCFWKHPFRKNNTKDANFWIAEEQSAKVPMMFSGRIPLLFHKYDELECKGLELHFENDDLTMFFLVPDRWDEFAFIHERIGEMDLISLRRRMQLSNMNVAVPRFRVKGSFAIKSALQKIGLDNLFANSADFSDFTQDRIKLDDVYYAAVIDVKEGGIDADGIDGETTTDSTPDFIIDRPFIYALMSKKYRLFSFGYIVNPLDVVPEERGNKFVRTKEDDGFGQHSEFSEYSRSTSRSEYSGYSDYSIGDEESRT